MAARRARLPFPAAIGLLVRQEMKAAAGRSNSIRTSWADAWTASAWECRRRSVEARISTDLRYEYEPFSPPKILALLKERASFEDSDALGFSLVYAAGEEVTNGVLNVDEARKELTFEGNLDDDDGTYYWSLPVQFLGNKLVSYGGNLTFSLSSDVAPRGAVAEIQVRD